MPVLGVPERWILLLVSLVKSRPCIGSVKKAGASHVGLALALDVCDCGAEAFRSA